MTKLHGDTSSLKPSHVRLLQKLGERTVLPDRVIGPALARDLLEVAVELNRRVGLFLDRRGRVTSVILGDAHSMQLPEFDRVRGVAGRLRGVRLVASHLVAQGLDREELADLAKLRLDLVASLHRGPAGIMADIAMLAPPAPEAKEAFTISVLPRVPLALLDPDGGPPVSGDLPVPFDTFLREREAELVASTARARAEVDGTRAMAMVVHKGGPHLDARINELRELCQTAGVALIDLVKQRRPHPDPRTFLGSGKLREVLVHALEQDVEVLICDPELSASQARTIADLTDLKVIDRTMLILDIFAKHASSADGKLQVELAQLRYNLPKMMGKGSMMSRLAGGIGGQGPGESKLEIDRRRANDRISDLERRLKRLKTQRDQKRARRQRNNVPVVAIVGYTNAGKSTLLNTVTQSKVDAEDKLFATLDPTVRRIRFPNEREIVMLDTVGFIRDLPPALMQAFSATLEEVAGADLLLHVVDATDPDKEQQIETVESILGELDAGSIPRFIVYNKCDDVLPEDIEILERRRRGVRLEITRAFFISALQRPTTRELLGAIEHHLWARGRTQDPPSDPIEGELAEVVPLRAPDEDA